MTPISGLFFLLPLILCVSLHPHLIAATVPVPAAAPKTATTAPVPAAAPKTATATAPVLAAAPKTATGATYLKNATTSTTTNSSLIEKACGSSQRKAFCLSVLKSDPTSNTADLKGLAFIALKAASKNATATSVTIKLWLNDSEAEPALDDALRACDQTYLDVVDQIGDSVNALVSGANGDVETWMKAAVADIDTCDGGVKGLTLKHAIQLTKKNRALRQLCNVGLGIVHVLARN